MSFQFVPLESTEKSHEPQGLDRAGIVLSAICLVHCTALPLILAGLQIYGFQAVPDLGHGSFHKIFAVVIFAVGGFAFVRGFQQHRLFLPLALGVFGTFLLFMGALNPFSFLGEFFEHGITVCGSLVLILAHVKNRKALKCCPDHHHHHIFVKPSDGEFWAVPAKAPIACPAAPEIGNN